jgi:predicted deacetylase
LNPERLDWDRHLLVIANETVAGTPLIEAVKRSKGDEPLHVTVICPVNQPREGYVVYQDTRRAAAGRRLDKTLTSLREAGILAQGFVVETDPVNAVRDALAQLEPPVTQIIVSTHPQRASSWLRRNVVDKIRDAARDLPVEHVVVDLDAEKGAANVLVLANETVVGAPLLATIKERASRSPASFLIVSPQSDPNAAEHPEAERRLRRALSELRSAGIDAHGQIAHPDPFTAAMQAVADERIDEIIVSTFPEARSGWLRRDLIGRLRQESGKPVEHVVTEAEPAEIGT